MFQQTSLIRSSTVLKPNNKSEAIAAAMSLSEATVKRHCRHLCRKLGMRNGKEAIERIARLGEMG